MTPTDYIQIVLLMENQNTDAIRERTVNTRTIRMLHALLGINTENGELQDQFKKFLIYGKPLDHVNLVEEAGDLLWYVGLLCDVLGVTMEHVMELNVAKLRKRYGPEGYSHERALNRDLEGERVILEEPERPALDKIVKALEKKAAAEYRQHVNSKYERDGSD